MTNRITHGISDLEIETAAIAALRCGDGHMRDLCGLALGRDTDGFYTEEFDLSLADRLRYRKLLADLLTLAPGEHVRLCDGGRVLLGVVRERTEGAAEVRWTNGTLTQERLTRLSPVA